MPIWGLLVPIRTAATPATQAVTTAFLSSATVLNPPNISGGAISGPVKLDQLTVEMGLGGSMRDILVNESFVQGFWPLTELVSPTALDWSSQATDLNYFGSFQSGDRGVALRDFSGGDIPEGVLATRFRGGQGVEIFNAPAGLSLAGGDIDVVFMIQTTQNDATLRCIAQKQDEPGSALNGWRVSLQSGQINFFLRVAGTTVFNFSRGAVADGNVHLIHCCYESTGAGARIFIDGAQSGATVAASTQPAATSGRFRIGMFNDGSGPFVGLLSYVMVGREGDPTLATRLQSARTWTDVTRDVRQSTAIDIMHGIRGNGPLDRLAATGTMSLTLDNSDRNSAGLVGYYSPEHVNARAGFEVRAPIRVKCRYQNFNKIRFYGFITTITPLSGDWGQKTTTVVASDWMNEAAEQFLGSLSTLTNMQSETVLGYVLDRADRRPAAVNLGVGDAKFLYAIDNSSEDTTILQEMQRINLSEFGWLYLRADGTLIYEGRTKRRGVVNSAYVFNKFQGVDVSVDRNALYNTIKNTVYPRTVDTQDVLWTLQNEQQLNPNETLTLDAPYKDPKQRAANVGGSDIVTPVITTDYTMFSAAGGGGNDVSANLQITVEKGGSRTTLHLKNTGNVVGFINKLQVRGTPVLTYDPIVVKREDLNSIRKFRRKTVTFDMPYQSYAAYASAVADQLLSVGAPGSVMPRALKFKANSSQDLMQQALTRDVGDRIGINDQVTGISTSGTRGFWISSVHFVINPERQIEVEYGLSVSDQIPDLNNQVLYTGPATGSADLSIGPLVLTQPGDYQFTIQRGLRLRIKGVAGGGAGSRGTVDSTSGSGGGGGGGGAAHLSGIVVDVGDIGSWLGSVGALGTFVAAGAVSNNGGDTWFGPLTGSRILHLQGGRGTGGATTTPGAGGAVIIGTGGVAGGQGGRGKHAQTDGLGVTGDAGAASGGAGGGGGAGSPGSGGTSGGTGGAGGNGHDTNGGAGGGGQAGTGAAGNGTSASGQAGNGANGTRASGGGGGGGGITIHASAPNLGGGGGGGGGAQDGSVGVAGSGAAGALVIALG